jgi:hypothetical protein
MMDNASVCYFRSISFISYPNGGDVFIDGTDQGDKGTGSTCNRKGTSTQFGFSSNGEINGAITWQK